MPTGPTPSTEINFSIGDDSLRRRSRSPGNRPSPTPPSARSTSACPSNGDAPKILDDTHLTLNALLDTSNIGLEANLGPFSAQAGAAIAGISGTALADSADDVLVVTTALSADQIPDGARIQRTSDQDTCVVTGACRHATATSALTCTGVAWAEGDAFSVLIGSELKGQLGLEVALAPWTDQHDHAVVRHHRARCRQRLRAAARRRFHPGGSADW